MAASMEEIDKERLSQRQSFTSLSSEACANLFDSDGRLVKVAEMNKAMFEGGVDEKWRRHLWKYLFKIYPVNSTHREQRTLDLENRARYQALHNRWVVLDRTVTFGDDEPVGNSQEYLELSEGEEGEEEEEKEKASKDDNACDNSVAKSSANALDVQNESDHDEIEKEVEEKKTTFSQRSEKDRSPLPPPHLLPDPCCAYCQRQRTTSLDQIMKEDEQEAKALLQILDFPSRVYATRQPVDLEKSYPKSKRTVLRDVLRTDRNIHYFSHKRNLRKVHRILHIYAMFHPDVGYCQGMNDLLARFLAVTDSEVDSYWMFCHYMDEKRPAFLEESMMVKVELVKNLLEELDKPLYEFFEVSECSDFLFCHRWLLLDFKREFLFSDSIRLFEVLSSHHLELTSDTAQKECDRVLAKEFEHEGGEMRAAVSSINPSFSFDLFVCVAILTLHKEVLTLESDAASVYGYLNSLCLTMDLNLVLAEAERLFYLYCKQSITSGFNEIDL